ncbi:hypothetical protein Sste5346_008448 [Sporothrix stenoceras]|uniref:Uncharacterized protein n=1 Tax=Sporothrix stenoceras TaxID=5173 RepID=A0ABR3YP63_9PEZI
MESLAKKLMTSKAQRKNDRHRQSNPPPPPPPTPASGAQTPNPAQVQSRAARPPPSSSRFPVQRHKDGGSGYYWKIDTEKQPGTNRRRMRQVESEGNYYDSDDDGDGDSEKKPDSFSRVIASLFQQPPRPAMSSSNTRNGNRNRPMSTSAAATATASSSSSGNRFPRRRSVHQLRHQVDVSNGAAASTPRVQPGAAVQGPAIQGVPPRTVRSPAAVTTDKPAVRSIQREPDVLARQVQLLTTTDGLPPRVTVTPPQPPPITPKPVPVPAPPTATSHPADGLPPPPAAEVDIVIHNLHADARGTCRAVRTQPMPVLLSHMMGVIAREQLLLHSVAATVHSITIVLEDGTLGKKRKKGFWDFTAELVNLPGVVDGGGAIEHNEHVMAK